MKSFKIYSTIVVMVLGFCIRSAAQDAKLPPPILTADSLATGNYKDVLTSFFQLGLERLTSPEKDIRFTSNPYAIMMRARPELAIDTNYARFKALRNLNFSFGLRLDSSFKFNGFTSGLNYAIINKRDYTVYREFVDLAVKKRSEFTTLNVVVNQYATDPANNADLAKRVDEQWTKLTRTTDFTLAQADKDVRAVIEKLIADNNLEALQRLISSNNNVNIKDLVSNGYNEVKNAFKNRLLWTIGVTDTTYEDQFMFSNVVVSTQLLKGISNPASHHNVEFDVKGMYNILDDTLRLGRDLRRSLLNFEGGLNYVWRSMKTDLSFFEFKLSAAYSRIFNGIYEDERKEIFTLNGTLRVRVFDDIWVPVVMKYDPKTGNVFGFLNVKANFTALKKGAMQKLIGM
ncbi:MAG: hypothetical protein H7Y31_11760 [Chitinophagaceae bacterium]|nr:hypothetical protein [Chitinophagaceae bacterium]